MHRCTQKKGGMNEEGLGRDIIFISSLQICTDKTRGLFLSISWFLREGQRYRNVLLIIFLFSLNFDWEEMHVPNTPDFFFSEFPRSSSKIVHSPDNVDECGKELPLVTDILFQFSISILLKKALRAWLTKNVQVVSQFRVRNCAFLVANATKNSTLATRISQLVASGD